MTSKRTSSEGKGPLALSPRDWWPHVANHGVDLPYYVRSQPTFHIDRCLTTYEYDKGDGKTKSRLADYEQLQFYHVFYSAVRNQSTAGLTLCVAGDVHYGLVETVAASMCMAAVSSGSPTIVWTHAAEIIKRSVIRYDDLPAYQALMGRVPDLAVITGLDWAAPDFRWVGVSDFMRSLPRQTYKIVVGVGATPHQVMRRLRIPFQMAMNLSHREHTVDMT